MKSLAALVVALATVSPALAQHAMPSHESAAPRSPLPAVVARVNGVAIRSDRLVAAINALMPLQSFHRTVDPAKVAELREKALRGLVDEELRYQEGRRRGLTASDAAVNAELARARRTYRSAAAFEEARQRAGVTMGELRSEIRRTLIARQAYATAVPPSCRVGAADAARFYADNTARFVVPEQLHIYAITIRVDPSSTSQQWADAKTVAEDVLRQLRAGAPFAEMARKYSTDESRLRAGDMGFVHRGSLADEFEAAARDLRPGEISGVVQTLYGFHIVQLGEIRPAKQKTFAEVGPAIRKELTARRCAEANDAWLARLHAAATIELFDDAAAGSPAGADGRRR